MPVMRDLSWAMVVGVTVDAKREPKADANTTLPPATVESAYGQGTVRG